MIPGTSEPAAGLPPPVVAGRRILKPNIVPARWRAELQSVLITEAQLRRRVRELAQAIIRDHAQGELLVVPILTGTLMFMADLLRHLTMPLRLDFVGVSSYRDGTRPAELVFTKDLRLDAQGRDVLLVDDILDTGNTLAAVQTRLRRLKPRRLRTCVLLDKPARRQRPVYVDYIGFEIPNTFVVGYGLDYAERYRNLPFVGVLKPELYAKEPAGR